MKNQAFIPQPVLHSQMTDNTEVGEFSRDAVCKSWSNYGPVIASDRSETGSQRHPYRQVSMSYDKNGCHGRGREFESRRPRHFKTPAFGNMPGVNR